jgi:hypothetical protein
MPRFSRPVVLNPGTTALCRLAPNNMFHPVSDQCDVFSFADCDAVEKNLAIFHQRTFLFSFLPHQRLAQPAW